MLTSKPKYLFEVEFEDGSLYLQNPDDISSVDKTRSCWYDIEQEFMPHKQWKRLTLFNEDGIDHSVYSDGHFEVAGLPFRVHECDHPLKNVMPAYHRRHWQDINVSASTDKATLGDHRMCWRFGFKALDMLTGERIERIMEVD